MRFILRTEIGNFDAEVLVQQEIFRLEIPVDDVVSVTVFHARDYLLEEAARVVLFELK